MNAYQLTSEAAPTPAPPNEICIDPIRVYDPQERPDMLPPLTENNLLARREWFLRNGFDRHFDGVCG